MQHDTNIEDKLREMEALEQPDLSQMDKHWQQMQALLQPGSLPVKKGWPKWMLNTLSVAAVVILIGAAILYTLSKRDSNNEKTAQESAIVIEGQNDVASKENSNTVIAGTTDTITKESKTTLNKPAINADLISQYEDQGNGAANDWTEEDSILATVKLNYIPCETCPGKEAGVLSNAERQLKLTSLFAQLQKQEQHFTIDNSRDTLLQFAEGTALLVPANSFGGMKGIDLTAKEFYKTSDIVLNQLNTASNKEQLETGGMLQLKASFKGNELQIDSKKPLTLFMPEAENNMKGMQLFFGEPAVQSVSTLVVQLNNELDDITEEPVSNSVDWIAKPQYFLKRKVVTEARVLNLANIPWLVSETNKKKVGYFIYNEDSLAMDKDELKKILKDKYGYTKVKLRSSIRNRFFITFGDIDKEMFNRNYSERIGDSLWMNKTDADRYKLNAVSFRKVVVEETIAYTNNISAGVQPGQENLLMRSSLKPLLEDTLPFNVNKAIADINYRYSVNLDKLGWINCDRFYSDNRKKIQFKVDLGDSATNYYTMLVFDKLNSMMTGFVNGNQVAFQNIPVGEPVKVISIGINKKGETVYSVTHTTTSEVELKGLQFQATSVPDLRTALSKYDK